MHRMVAARGRYNNGCQPASVTAFDDHVRVFDPDHIVLALRSPEHADWQEKGLIDRIQSEVGIPLTVFQIDPQEQAPRQ
jgi:hypothetical protein